MEQVGRHRRQPRRVGAAIHDGHPDDVRRPHGRRAGHTTGDTREVATDVQPVALDRHRAGQGALCRSIVADEAGRPRRQHRSRDGIERCEPCGVRRAVDVGEAATDKESAVGRGAHVEHRAVDLGTESRAPGPRVGVEGGKVRLGDLGRARTVLDVLVLTADIHGVADLGEAHDERVQIRELVGGVDVVGHTPVQGLGVGLQELADGALGGPRRRDRRLGRLGDLGPEPDLGERDRARAVVVPVRRCCGVPTGVRVEAEAATAVREVVVVGHPGVDAGEVRRCTGLAGQVRTGEVGVGLAVRHAVDRDRVERDAGAERPRPLVATTEAGPWALELPADVLPRRAGVVGGAPQADAVVERVRTGVVQQAVDDLVGVCGDAERVGAAGRRRDGGLHTLAGRRPVPSVTATTDEHPATAIGRHVAVHPHRGDQGWRLDPVGPVRRVRVRLLDRPTRRSGVLGDRAVAHDDGRLDLVVLLQLHDPHADERRDEEDGHDHRRRPAAAGTGTVGHILDIRHL